MGVDAKIMGSHIVNTIVRSMVPIARWVRGLMDARRRRIEHERAFYRDFSAYCRANGLPPVCEDDWKSGR